jgi:endonuclease/exonuclease/phosphatase family metal-dependent hydrolase
VLTLEKSGEPLVVVNVHGSSGLKLDDTDCRVKQFSLVFEDMNGGPAADGARNIVLGDLNTDPARADSFDKSAEKFNEHAGPGKRFEFITEVGVDAVPTYAGNFNIDHVVSDAFSGSCWAAGVSEGRPAVSEVAYFDHKPSVCTLRAR